MRGLTIKDNFFLKQRPLYDRELLGGNEQSTTLFESTKQCFTAFQSWMDGWLVKVDGLEKKS